MIHLVTLRFADGRAITVDDPARNELARLVSRLGRDAGLLAWRAEGCLLHMLVDATRYDVGELARAVSTRAQQRFGRSSQGRKATRFLPARVQPVEDPREAAELAVVLLADGDSEDALHLASNLPDVLGLRLLADYTLPRLCALPGFDPARLADSLPEHDEEPRVFVWSTLPQATAAVFGHDGLDERLAWRSEALAAAARVAVPRIGVARTARLLGVGRTSLVRAMDRRLDRSAARAVRLQLAVRTRRAMDEAGITASDGRVLWALTAGEL